MTRRTYISRPQRGVIYVLEPARRGSRKLKASAMPEIVTPGMTGREATDQPVPYRSVPLAIRRAARKFFAPGQIYSPATFQVNRPHGLR